MQYLYDRETTEEKFFKNFQGNSIDAEIIYSAFIINRIPCSHTQLELLIARYKEMQVLLGLCELNIVKNVN